MKEYRTLANLICPVSNNKKSVIYNERTLLSEKVRITKKGTLYCADMTGTVLFRAPVTPYLENLPVNNTYLSITYSGEIRIKPIYYYQEKPAKIGTEFHQIAGEATVTCHIPLELEENGRGCLDFNCFLTSGTAIFSLTVDEEIPNDTTAPQFTPIAHCIFPDQDICTEEKLYFRLNGNEGFHSSTDKSLIILPGGHVSFSTYFNSFSVTKWNTYTTVNDLDIAVTCEGSAILEVWHAVSENEIVKVASTVVNHQSSVQAHLLIGDLSKFTKGILYLEIHALTQTTVTDITYGTRTPGAQDVKLGVVITTFKREDDIKKTANRFKKAFQTSLADEKIQIFVIDNGQTLTADDVDGTTLIPNRNLGGSGGFTRGLIECEKEGSFTHCLFMDDDAFCEPESIFRACVLLKFRKQENLAVSGAMLLAEHMHVQYENGAWFDMQCHPLKCGFDLRDISKLCQNEIDDISIKTYGAWWFFAFPIKAALKCTFPFFVRGDDVEFSYLNDFTIIRTNGIGIWQEDFKLKEGPNTLYLDVRSHFVHAIMLNHLKFTRFNVIKMVYFFMTAHNLSYEYNTARAILYAFEDAIKGPDFWEENIEMVEVRKKIKLLAHDVHKISDENLFNKENEYAHENLSFSTFNPLIRTFTFNGHLLPSFLINQEKKWQLSKRDLPHAIRVFLRSEIQVVNPETNQYYTLKKNPKYFLKNMGLFLKLACKLVLKFSKLEKQYKAAGSRLTSRDFWKKQFTEDPRVK